MTTGPRAKLGPAARHELCRLIAAGASIRRTARTFNVARQRRRSGGIGGGAPARTSG